MDVKLILTLILGSSCAVLVILSVILYRKDKSLQRKSTKEVEGTVVGYSINTSRAPVVEYRVNEKVYKKALKYSYVSNISTPFNSIRAKSKDDLLDTKLRIKNNSLLSANTLMKDRFPLGSNLKVYYNPNNPKQAFVERFSPSYMYNDNVTSEYNISLAPRIKHIDTMKIRM